MKRFISVLAALIIMTCVFTLPKAEGMTDALPPLAPIKGVEDIGSARAVLMDLDTGAVIYEKNSDERAVPGSLTTIMTALLLIEDTAAGDWDTPLPALKAVNSTWTSRGAQMGLQKGDTPTRRDLLYALLLQGSADAAYVTEMLVSGSESDFVDGMNKKAAELGMTETNFGNGYGLGAGNHYTCAHDLALLVRRAMQNDMFSIAVKTKDFTCSAGAREIRLSNTNEMLGSGGCIGVKSGSDSEKAHCVIEAVEAGSLRLCAIVLEASSDSMAMSLAERLIAAGVSSYASEGGYFPTTPTNAYFIAVRDLDLKSPSGGSARVSEGEGMRVCGSFAEPNGDIKYCVFHQGSFYWAKAEDMAFVSFIDDIFIENGEALSREVLTADSFDITTYAVSRHLIKNVSVTLRLPDGTAVLTSSHAPNAHGLCEMSGTSFAEGFESRLLSEGLYYCTVEITAEAFVQGCEPKEIVKTNSSILAVGTGGEVVSYNANAGENAPEGECFFDSFTIPSDVPLRTGYDFIGWNALPDGTGAAYMPCDTVAYDGSLTLYAQWKPAASHWTVEVTALYDTGLQLEGTVRNPAGITSLRLEVITGTETVYDYIVACLANEAEPGRLLLPHAVLHEKGEHTVRLYGSAGGEEELLSEQKVEVSREEAAKTPIPSETARPTDTAPKKPFINLGAVPIVVWFILGAVVVAVLIALMVMIIKRG